MSGLPKIGMLYGGWNSEAEVSRASANFCATIARECGYDVIEIEFDRNLPIYLNENKIDIVFNTSLNLFISLVNSLNAFPIF